MWQWKEEARLCEIRMWDSKSHLTRFLSLLHCASLCIWDGVCQLLIQQFLKIFLVSLKQQQNLMKIMFSCTHLPIWPYLPKIMKKLYFILVNCMGQQVCSIAELIGCVYVSSFGWLVFA